MCAAQTFSTLDYAVLLPESHSIYLTQYMILPVSSVVQCCKWPKDLGLGNNTSTAYRWPPPSSGLV